MRVPLDREAAAEREMPFYLLLFGPVILLVILSPVLRRARRYTLVSSILAPVIVLVGLAIQYGYYYRPTVEGALSLEQAEAITLGLAGIVVAGWAAVFATTAFGIAERFSGPSAVSAWHGAAICGIVGALIGGAFPVAVVASLGGRSAFEFFWVGVYAPGAAAGAVCGALLPRFVSVASGPLG